MTTFILVHGGLHGGWCWEKVVPHLERAGHKAIAPDLPGSGMDNISPEHVTLEMTGGFVADLAHRVGEPAVLVGHSLGGITISDAAERAAHAVLGLVYVAAILLPNGGQAFGNHNGGNSHSPGFRVSDDGGTLMADPAAAAEIFYNGCAKEDVRSAVARLMPQPTRPLRDCLSISEARYGTVPRAYVECLQDNAHPLHLQRKQQAAMPCWPVFTMDTGHSPFVQAPEEFAVYLIEAAAAFAAKAG
ncbi:alpha/beta fold hydrolase [Sphingobium sp. V4]|uniref:alpha/beta fold hydrolase n=1 Tax=Sphingobium sp. V4 TaxID=3038927 RepID=UPI00255827BE|nr:alpha/beta fold hydrolase [Sphingobium sp. V4]WIW89439.1 alpha/beta fold hydrolase [Sphingobium sp. V4]